MEYIVRYWRKPEDCMPVIGQFVIVQFDDGRQTVLSSFSSDCHRPEWVTVSGQNSPSPAFWLDEQPEYDGAVEARW